MDVLKDTHYVLLEKLDFSCTSHCTSWVRDLGNLVNVSGNETQK